MSTVRTAPTSPTRSRFSWYKAVAVALWLAGAWTTYALIARLGAAQPVWAGVVAAFVVQAFLTALESPVWRGKPGPVNLVAVVIDTFANAGGLYPFMANIGATPPAQMFVAAFGLDATIAPAVAVMFALVGGYMLAAGPESIWRWE
jgi:hypothetical protein